MPMHVTGLTVASVNPPPICDNCRRIVDRTQRVGLMVEGKAGMVRHLCSACRVSVVDSFEQPASWLQPIPPSRSAHASTR
jgi:hypothetical protein